MDDLERIYTVTHYASLMGVNRRTVYNWIKAGTGGFELVMVGSRRMIKPNDNVITVSSDITELNKLSLHDLISLESYINHYPQASTVKLINKIKIELESRIKKLL
jgi:excisionase family DNA binding protein